MDIKWKKFSYSITAKIVAFIVVITCFASAITICLNTTVKENADFGIVFEDSYYLGQNYMSDASNIVQNLRTITGKYKSEEQILNGGSLAADEIRDRENQLYRDFEFNSNSYNPKLTTAENYAIFKEIYADKISGIKDQLIKEDLNEYKAILRELDKYPGVIYFANNDNNMYTNSSNQTKDYFKTFPSYIIFDESERKAFPEEVNENINYQWFMPNPNMDQLEEPDILYVAFTEDYLNPRIADWNENKILATHNLYQIAGFSLGLVLSFIYLLLVIGRKNQDDQRIHLSSIDRIYNDINLGLCVLLIAAWVGVMDELIRLRVFELIFPITLLIAAPGLILVLALVKHLKNKTFIKHTLIYYVFHQIIEFIGEVYKNGNVAVKVVLIVIGYPCLLALTFFICPITIAAAAWFALKQVKKFNAIKEGVKRVKSGDIHYTLNVSGEGEFASLASDINSITDGLNKAVENEVKSERLKSELISNVSHDIRTPLTSIITYVDLLKNEQDQSKVKEYIDIIDQKSQRLKILTDDLFEATKASSGNIPVSYETIDVVSLITQGLGELDDKIQERRLEFKINHSQAKEYVKADGKLLWRAIENLLINTLNYALEGSRVYIDILDSSNGGVRIVIKNISARELNISADELMERFKRGDESRSSQGSGLGLSIAKSLIEIQKGSLDIEIDGDLFKAIIQMNKA